MDSGERAHRSRGRSLRNRPDGVGAGRQPGPIRRSAGGEAKGSEPGLRRPQALCGPCPPGRNFRRCPNQHHGTAASGTGRRRGRCLRAGNGRRRAHRAHRHAATAADRDGIHAGQRAGRADRCRGWHRHRQGCGLRVGGRRRRSMGWHRTAGLPGSRRGARAATGRDQGHGQPDRADRHLRPRRKAKVGYGAVAHPHRAQCIRGRVPPAVRSGGGYRRGTDRGPGRGRGLCRRAEAARGSGRGAAAGRGARR